MRLCDIRQSAADGRVMVDDELVSRNRPYMCVMIGMGCGVIVKELPHLIRIVGEAVSLVRWPQATVYNL